MIGLRKFLWLGPALLAAPLPAAAQDMCAALDRLAASSREPVPFASLQERNARGVEADPGFRRPVHSDRCPLSRRPKAPYLPRA